MEISKEEKEAINTLKRTIKNSNYCDSIGIGQIETLLNYIDKLQKENEELKSENSSYADILNAEIKDYDTLKEKYENINWYFENQKDNFVHKDKIRAEIKELEEILERRKTIDIVEEINRLDELLEGE